MFDVRPMRPNLAPVFAGLANRDVRAATAMAVTAVAGEVQKALTQELARAIDRPTSFTAGAIMKRPRRDGPFFAYEVFIRDEASKGTPPSKYLAPLIYGGSRGQKRFERALALTGAMASGLYAMPGLGAKLDAFGNMPAGQIRQILSYVGAAQITAGYQGNSSQKLKRRLAKGSKKKGTRGFAYFVSGGPGSNAGHSRGKQRLPAGIYQRTSFGKLGSAIKPVLIFAKAPSYQPRIRFYETVQSTVQREWPGAFDRGLSIALSSSKRLS